MKTITTKSDITTTITPGPFGGQMIETDELVTTTVTTLEQTRSGASVSKVTIIEETHKLDIIPARRPSMNTLMQLVHDEMMREDAFKMPRGYAPPISSSRTYDPRDLEIREAFPFKGILAGRSRTMNAPPVQSLGIDTPRPARLDQSLARPTESDLIDWVLASHGERAR